MVCRVRIGVGKRWCLLSMNTHFRRPMQIIENFDRFERSWFCSSSVVIPTIVASVSITAVTTVIISIAIPATSIIPVQQVKCQLDFIWFLRQDYVDTGLP